MELEKIIQSLIYLHAGLGGIALVAGATALLVQKGGRIHKKSGKLFFFAMITSAFLALVIALMPNHENPFLFSIGVFSAYFILSGYRSLRFKREHVELRTDQLIAYGIMLTGITMILYPIILHGKANIILLIFGAVGFIFGLRDIQLFKDKDRLKKSWLRLHLGKMTGGYIAAVSAFLVVNQILPGVWNWFVPTIIGSAYITYSMQQLKQSKIVVNQDSSKKI